MEDNGSMCKNVKPSVDAAAAAPAAVAVVVTTNTTTITDAPTNAKTVQFKLAARLAAEPPEELLGSVTTQNCPGTRASARVIQKMKLDQTRPMTPPPPEREQTKKDEKAAQKTPSQMRAANKTTWTNVERNCFFDALNEVGKDFETMANCINTKLKRRNTSNDHSFKTKDQVRQHYYQTYHKIGKYVRFSDELRKPAQELYTLINYGEMRRKLQFLTEKHFMKLKQLVYQGHITVRCKGKNIRIKTPSCKALRRLNQLDDTLEDIRLPTKIEVLVNPANMEAFGRVQSLAQNPRIRATVPLHKKLISFIQTFQYKWRSNDARLAERQQQLLNGVGAGTDSTAAVAPAEIGPANELVTLCFLPKPGVAIHRPLLSITAHLSNVNICLSAYEERLGVKVRSETLDSTAAAAAASAKRARTESGSEKRSPEAKKLKPLSAAVGSAVPDKSHNELGNEGGSSSSNLVKMESSSGDELGDDLIELLNLTINGGDTIASVAPPPPQQPPAHPTAAQTAPAPPTRGKRSDALGAGGGKSGKANAVARNFRPLLSDDVIKRMRKGWTISNAADITIGDLYVVLGQDAKLELDYYWCDVELSTLSSSTVASANTISTTSSSSSASTSNIVSASSSSTSATSLPYNVNDCDSSVERVKAITTSTVSNKLKHLLLISSLSERVRKRQCSCGHSCDRKTKAQWMSSLASQQPAAAAACAATSAAIAAPSNDGNDIVFRTPMLPVRRPMVNIIDPSRQLSKLTRQKMSRQVLVQRLLQPPDSGSQSYDLLNLQNGLFEPIERVSISNNNNNNNNIINNNNLTNSSSNRTNTASLPRTVSSKNSYKNTSKNISKNTAKNNGSSSSNSSSIIISATPQQIDSKSCYGSSSSSCNSTSSDCVVGLDMPSLDMPSLDLVVAPPTAPTVSSHTDNVTPNTLPEGVQDESTMNSLFNGSVSPNHLLRDSTSNARWLEENINDFSLTSLLGHLDDFDATRDILNPSSSLSVISETSVDYRHKFQEISALLQQQEKD